jgi:hypothetical protein
MSNVRDLIETRVEAARGCGYRRRGLYLVADGLSATCGKLPIPLHVCPTCGGGIHPCRGWTWIRLATLAGDKACSLGRKCPKGCVLRVPPQRAGLLWIGKKFYETPQQWRNEAAKMGVSRRISRLPNGFEVGSDWVAVAHREAVADRCGDCLGMTPTCERCRDSGTVKAAGIFHMFRPDRVEYVVGGDETDEQLGRLVDRGFTLVRVVRDTDYSPLFGEELR